MKIFVEEPHLSIWLDSPLCEMCYANKKWLCHDALQVLSSLKCILYHDSLNFTAFLNLNVHINFYLPNLNNWKGFSISTFTALQVANLNQHVLYSQQNESNLASTTISFPT